MVKLKVRIFIWFIFLTKREYHLNNIVLHKMHCFFLQETMVKTGYASCFCMVKGKKVQIIKKRPVAQTKNMIRSAGFGAGGMAGTIVICLIIYSIVNKLRQPRESSISKPPPMSKPPRISGSRVHPHQKQGPRPEILKPQLNF